MNENLTQTARFIKYISANLEKEADVLDKFYTTKKLLGAKKADLWRQFISETFVELDCNGMSRDDFFGELRARTVGGLGISTITTDAYDVFRTEQSISKAEHDDFIVGVQTSGSSTIRQLGREVTLNPGDFAIYDSTMPYHLHFTSRLSQLIVKIPRDHLKKHMSAPESLTALRVEGAKGLAQITTKFATNLFHQTDALDIQSQEQVADTFVALLSSSLRDAAAQKQRQPHNREVQLLWVKQYIEQNIRDPKLSLKQIAAHQQISERYIHILFESEDITPSRYIWNERLKSAQSDLSNALLAHRSISQICFEWGFNDTAHFSRAFKTKFGISPRAYRKTALN